MSCKPKAAGGRRYNTLSKTQVRQANRLLRLYDIGGRISNGLTWQSKSSMLHILQLLRQAAWNFIADEAVANGHIIPKRSRSIERYEAACKLRTTLLGR